MDRVPSSACSPSLRRALRKSLLLVPLLCLSTAQLQGQSPSDRVYQFLESASGFQLLGRIHTGLLESGKAMAIGVTLMEGAEYMVVGYCDDACGDIDLILLGPDGEVIQDDQLPDSEPILMLAAETTGPHFIQANAVECAATGCNISVGILASTAEPGVGPGEDMAGRLLLVGSEFKTMGFTKAGGERRGALTSDQSVTLPIPFQEGLEYRIAGVCDRDCFDLDLVLRDPRGTVVDSDLLNDALPILAHVADTTGDYQMEVSMVACGVEPCVFRIAAFAKDQEAIPDDTTLPGTLVFLETYSGQLEDGDETLPDGEYVDVYEIEARSGQRLIMDLRSQEFEPFLRLVAPDGVSEEVAEDDEALGHSHLEVFTLMEGVYSVQASSFGSGVTGSYTLQIAIMK